MNKLIIIGIGFLMITSPLLFLWTGNIHQKNFEYSISISPLYYTKTLNNKYITPNNITEYEPIYRLSNKDLYTDKIVDSISLFILGLLYFLMSIATFMGFISSAMKKSRKGMDIMIFFYILSFLVYFIYFYFFITNAGLTVQGSAGMFECSLGLGFIAPLVVGGLYALERIANL